MLRWIGRRGGSRPEASGSAEDRALLAAVAARDPAALERLYARHASAVFGLCLRVLRHRSEAEEVLEDVFFELWERSDRFDPERSTPLAYLITLARSRAIDRLRRERRRAPFGDTAHLRAAAREPVAPGDGPLVDAECSERRRLVAALLESLEPGERQSLELSFFAGLSHSEIATRLELPLGTIKTRIRRALVRLRIGLEERGLGAELP